MKKAIYLGLIIILIVSSISLAACGGDDEGGESPNNQSAATQGDQQSSGETDNENEDQSEGGGEQHEASGDGSLPWEDIPIYPGAELDVTNPCPPQWEGCQACEKSVYLISEDPVQVCEYYQDEMPNHGWEGNCQIFPEGACSGAWSKEMGNKLAPRVIIGIGQRTRNDETTSISMTLGTGCP